MAITYDRTLAVSLSVSDLAASRDWYRDTLGLAVVFDLVDEGWCELGFGVEGITFGLNQADGGATVGSTVPTLGVTDIAAARAELEGKGVAFDGDTVEIPGMVKLANFHDPDGNPLCLVQNLMG